MICRDATFADVPTIMRLRDEYYARREAPVQVRKPTLWRVVESEGAVIAVQAYEDVTPQQRVITDTYADRCRQAVWALRMLDHEAKERARRDGVILVGMTEPDNLSHLNASVKHGWNVSGVLLSWDPKEHPSGT